TALSRKTANVKNAYDPGELSRLHSSLRFDSRWDKASGFKTAQVLATPILFEKYLLGVLQLINKRGGGSFTAKDEELAEQLAKVLGIAFYNQHRAGRQIPEDVKARLTAEFLKKNMCAPIEKREGTLFVAVEDPYDLTRLDS